MLVVEKSVPENMRSFDFEFSEELERAGELVSWNDIAVRLTNFFLRIKRRECK